MAVLSSRINESDFAVEGRAHKQCGPTHKTGTNIVEDHFGTTETLYFPTPNSSPSPGGGIKGQL